MVSTETHPFIDHLVISQQFLRDHALERVGELLENQGWSHLFLENCKLNKELARQFFSTLVLSGVDSSTVGTFTINGVDHAFIVRELSKILNVPSTGFSDYIKQVWPAYLPRDVMINRVLGPASSSRGHSMSQENMDVYSKICYMLLRANIVPRKEGREKVGILDVILINKLLDNEKISLPLLILKHLEHAQSIPHHRIPYGPIIKKILQDFELYEEGSDIIELGKPLDKRCLQQAHFKFEDGSWKSSCPLPPVEEERRKEDLASDLGSFSSTDKCYVFLSNLIKEFSSNVNKQFLGVAK